MSNPAGFEKHSVSIPVATSEGVRARVGSRGLSAYVADAVARQLERDALDDVLGLQAWAAVAGRTDSVLFASTIRLAEVSDGSARHARVRRVAKALRIEVVSEEIGYRAGRLRAAATSARRKQRDLTVDAVVAATASTLLPPVVILTGDDGDLRLLLAGTSGGVEQS